MEFDPHAHAEYCPYCGFKKSEGEHAIHELRDNADGTMEMVLCKPLVIIQHPAYVNRIEGVTK